MSCKTSAVEESDILNNEKPPYNINARSMIPAIIVNVLAVDFNFDRFIIVSSKKIIKPVCIYTITSNFMFVKYFFMFIIKFFIFSDFI